MRAVWPVMLALALVTGGCAPAAMESRPAPAPSPPARTDPASVDAARVAEQLTRLAAQIGELQNTVARLLVNARQSDERLDVLERRVIELGERARAARVMPEPPSDPPAAPMPGRAPTAPPATPPPRRPSPAQELYDAAQAKLKGGDPDGAVLLFYELIASYPTDPLRERAQFAVGDTYFAARDCQAAAGEFEALVNAFPRGATAPEALLKLGLCRQTLGDQAAARQAWEQLVARHPRSDAARRARDLLKDARKS